MSFDPVLSPSSGVPPQGSFRAPFSQKHGRAKTPIPLFFEQGIIGFGNCQKYILAEAPQKELRPLYTLVNPDHDHIMFFVSRFEDVGESVCPNLSLEVSQKMGLGAQDLQGFYLVTVQGSYPDSLSFSINKRAPLFIDLNQQKGGQYFLNDQNLAFMHFLPDLSQKIVKRLQRIL